VAIAVRSEQQGRVIVEATAMYRLVRLVAVAAAHWGTA